MFPRDYRFGDLTRGLLGLGSRGESDTLSDKQDLKRKLSKSKEKFLQEKGEVNEAKKNAVKTDELNHHEEKFTKQHLTASVSAKALHGAVWPDPDPNVSQNDSTVFVDDVTRLNKTAVKRVFQVRNIDDVQKVLELARTNNCTVSMRGTQHCMGGHTIAPDGLVIDTCRMRDMIYHPDKQCVTVGPGVRWSDLIYYLNEFGQSPHTMQSYASFSVGGTVAVNAHGITTDLCSHESVLEFTLVKWDGSVVICRHDSEDPVELELFQLCIGGYGLFGVMTELVLKCVPNSHLRMEMIPCKIQHFPRIYKTILQDPANDIDIKLARLDITNCDDINIFVFHRTSKFPTRSELPSHPKMMSLKSQVVYKWLAPNFGSLRYSVERYTGRAVDWSDVNERNMLLYESAEPLARMYSPFFDVDDTFILQEYFVPFDQFQLWMKKVSSKIVKASMESNKHFTLLNTTIRYVQEDKRTMLAYSRVPGGSFAFVLYFRMRRTEEADMKLQRLHNDLVNATLDCGGTFYLPYRHHYSQSQLEAAYPSVSTFFEVKAKHDPHGMFDSLWFRQYGRTYFDKVAKPTDVILTPSPPSRLLKQPVTVREVGKRSDSYRKVFHDPILSKEFFDSFLVLIFNVENSTTLQHAISRAIWDHHCTNDLDIYQRLCSELSNTGALQALAKTWRQIKQLRSQKKELLRETSSILTRIGKLGTIQDYVSIGDNGKMVLAFKDALNFRGTTYIVHDKEPEGIDMSVILERGSLEPVGEFILYDILRPSRISIPDNSADLVTMNQGLHHIPEQYLIKFVQEVYRILRPGGIFIVREHDATPHLLPLLDIAHSVFNAVTGVGFAEEHDEVRAFRPILEWRQIIESVGFTDTMMYEMESGDPTRDEMMAFCKGDLSIHQTSTTSQHVPSEKLTDAPVEIPKAKGAVAQLPMLVDSVVSKVPNILLEVVQNIVDGLLFVLDQSEAMILQANIPAVLRNAIRQTIDNHLDPVKQFLAKLRPFLDDVKLADGQYEVLPPEVFLIIQTLFAKEERGDKLSLNESIAVTAVKKIIDMFSPATQEDQPQAKPSTIDTSLSASEVAQLFDNLFQAIPNLLEEESLKQGGLGFIVRVGKSYLNNTSGEQIASMLVPILDEKSWNLMKEPLEQIIQQPEDNPFTMENICKRESLWWKTTMGFLSSPHVKLGPYRVMASWFGIGPIISMWSEAQQNRKQEEGASSSHGLSESAQRFLSNAVKLSHLENDMEILVDSLNETGLIDETKSNEGVEYTWYKLVEWMQVEFVQIFGDYMEHTPWYRFPFMDMLYSYFEVLFKEFNVVSSSLGFNRAAFSNAFFVDLIPGVVMAALFAQMQLLALPLKKGLGDTYSEEDVATQVEKLIVTVNPKQRDNIDWKEIDNRIVVKELVPGLYELTIPSLKPFSDVLQNIAASDMIKEHVRILRISNHEEVQMRVTVPTNEQVMTLQGIRGCSVKFAYQLPARGDSSTDQPEVSVSLGVKTVHLLHCIRECAEKGASIAQIYDFWA